MLLDPLFSPQGKRCEELLNSDCRCYARLSPISKYNQSMVDLNTPFITQSII